MMPRLALKAPPDAAELLPEDEDARLRFILDATYRRVLLEMHHLVADALELDPASFRLDDTATTAILEHAAQRVTGINATTRAALQDLLAAANRDGLSTAEIIAQIDHLYLTTWKSRSEMIATTEIGEAQRVSAIDRYKASGLVDRVKISDATRGGDHTATCLARAGTTVSLDEAPPLDHPNCSLVLLPILRGDA